MKKIILTFTLLALIFTSCAAPKQDTDNNSSKAETTQATSVSEKSSSSAENSSKAKNTASKPDENNFAITQDEAVNIVRELYGSLYIVNEPEYKNDILYFSVEDKTGKPFAEISVNLKTADAKEKLFNTGETIEFNLLS